jgi:two-component system chemotaxis response regulator CheB
MKINCELLIIGGSAGSLEVLLQGLPHLDPGLPMAIIIVLHRKNDERSLLTDLLSSRTKLNVKEAEDKDTIKAGTIYIAPSNYHLLVEKNKTLSLDYSEKINYSRPSIDATFQTAADAYGKNLVCILLSGSNADGVEGLLAVKEAQGITAVQAPATCEVSYMPAQALLRVAIDHVVDGHRLADFIKSLHAVN